MLRKAFDEPVMTIAELREHYADNWFRYSIIEDAPPGCPEYNAKARVIFFADSNEELLSIPTEQRYAPGYPSGGDAWGKRVNPEPGVQIGGVEVAWV